MPSIKYYVIISILLVNASALYYLFIYSNSNRTIGISYTPTGIGPPLATLLKSHTVISPWLTYSLDSECKSNQNDSLSQTRMGQFNNIFEESRWSPTGSRSGPGSTIEGAYEWIRHLQTFFQHYSIQSLADIPCGDTFWQFSIRELNTIKEIYFGGDISTSVIKQNQLLYGSKHLNKLFHYWDLVNCPIPTYTYKNSSHEMKGNHFDLIMVRDALQHMHIKNGLKVVKNVVMSGARYFAISSYPPNERSSGSLIRSLEKNETLPSKVFACFNINYCTLGNIKDGDLYHNNINCYPFSFPLDKALLIQPSHTKFPEEFDELHIYPIDEELKHIVQQYDRACL